MFRAEVEFRKTQEKEKNEAVNQMKMAMKVHDKLVKERDDLKNEVDRKQRLSIQAIAARGNMKQHLDEARAKCDELNLVIEDMKVQMTQAAKDVERYKQKHDDMFSSVSGLNQRIEELEQHKLHLLNKLKSYGDRGDLSYIVKTQKLENIKVKDLKDRVKVEDYKPEASRKQKDDEYERRLKEEEQAQEDLDPVE